MIWPAKTLNGDLDQVKSPGGRPADRGG